MYLSFVYLLFFLIIITALGVISAKNSLFSILFLALVFIFVSLIFFLIGAEFLAILLLVIYSGAMILLFLFIVFLLNLRNVELFNKHIPHMPIGICIGCFFLVSSYAATSSDFQDINWNISTFSHWSSSVDKITNLSSFGIILYEHMGFFVIAVSLILLAVMCSVIVLSSDLKKPSKKAATLYSLDKKTRMGATIWLKDKGSNEKLLNFYAA